jgi:hypothetical protein
MLLLHLLLMLLQPLLCAFFLGVSLPTQLIQFDSLINSTRPPFVVQVRWRRDRSVEIVRACDWVCPLRRGEQQERPRRLPQGSRTQQRGPRSLACCASLNSSSFARETRVCFSFAAPSCTRVKEARIRTHVLCLIPPATSAGWQGCGGRARVLRRPRRKDGLGAWPWDVARSQPHALSHRRLGQGGPDGVWHGDRATVED